MPALDTRDLIIIGLFVLAGMLALHILRGKVQSKRRPPSPPIHPPSPAAHTDQQYRADFRVETRAVVEQPVRKLTPREREVAELAARGKSNREIGDLLGGMSVNTVQNHLRHVYDKLNVRSRAELAAWWAKHGDGSRQM